MRKNFLKILFFLNFITAYSQNAYWTLRLQSNVYLRTWTLTTKAEKTEKEIMGAKVVLYEATTNKPIAQTVTDDEGKFVLDVPGNGLYYILVSYPNCNTKKMTVDTRNVPEKLQNENYRPKFTITGGFIMAKPYPGINYGTLSESLVHVQFMEGKRAFDDDKNFTERGVGICQKIYEAEWDLFMRFCDFNKKGDAALAIPDCPLAKQMYESALALIPGEFYPTQQLAKIPDCLKQNENKKKTEEEKKAREEQERLAKQKEAEEKAKREAEEKARKEAEKAEKERLAKEKAEQERLAKQKEEEERAKREAEEKARKEADRAEKERLAKEKAEQEKLAKQKAAEEKARQKAEEEKRKKEEMERLAKEKAEKAKEKEAEQTAKEQKIENVPGEPSEDPDPKKGKGKTTTYQILGSQENYKKNLMRANDLFKTKRYEEAKSAYQECLKYKPEDPLSKLRIRQCDSLLNLKK
ncbi:MAG: hypothetical protein N3F09_05155 [Bacteroidia bacterium]|nr:hypothetical protein [Bacteroidia bacterium]